MKTTIYNHPRKIRRCGAALAVIAVAAFGWTDVCAQATPCTEIVEGTATTITTPWIVQANPPVAMYSNLCVGNASAGELNIDTDGTVTNYYGTIAIDPGVQGTVTVTGPNAIWNTYWSFYVGYGGIGTLTIGNGGIVAINGGNGFLGHEPNSIGTVNVTGENSKWSITNNLYVGYDGEGILNISDKGVVSATGTSGSGYLGYRQGSKGTVAVTGSGSEWKNGNLRVGDSGNGELTIEEGGKVTTTSNGYIGDQSDGEGTVTVTGDGSTWSNGRLIVGHYGEGKLTIDDHGVVTTTGSGQIGINAGSTGKVTVADSGSQWQVGANLSVGGGNGGELLIANGGYVSSYGGGVSSASGTTGKITVTGSGSKWESSSSTEITISGEGTSLLTISGGGIVVSGNDGSIGSTPGSGAVEVAGNGSEWNHDGDLHLGHYDNSSGELTISGGSKVSNADAYVGGRYNPTSSGTVMVTGSNSRWTNTGNLYVGYYGNGELTISDGGTVQANAASLAYGTNASGTINIGAKTGDTTAAPGALNVTGTGGVSFRNGSGTLVFNHTAIASDNYTFTPPISGTNATGSNVNVLAGVTTLGGLNDYAGTTTVSGGTLKAGVANTGTAGAFSPNSDFVVGSGATLDANGLDQTIASLSNGGRVRVAPNGATSTALTVTGEYIDGGTLAVDARLGDDSSPTGRLVIEGSVSGTTMIDVTALAGSSGGQTGTGIVLVRMVGEANNDALNGAFALASSPLVAGNYEYTLSAVDDNGDKLFVLKSGQRAGGGGATAIPVLPLPLLLALAAAVGLLGRRRLRPGV